MRIGTTTPSTNTELLEWVRQAYAAGFFAMGSEETKEVNWYTSPLRALFPIEGIHCSRSFRRFLRSHPYRTTVDQDFDAVMHGCMRPGENWIVPDIVEWFNEMHRLGWAHSCEVWREDELVGGVYGLAVGSCFIAETMFHRETNCSKLALHTMIEHCRNLGFTVFDAQVMNPHLKSLGAFEMPHAEFLEVLRECQVTEVAWNKN